MKLAGEIWNNITINTQNVNGVEMKENRDITMVTSALFI